MLMSYITALYKFNIEFIKSIIDPRYEALLITCSDLTTLKQYEQKYELSELIETNTILQIYPKLLDSIIRKQQPNINFSQNGAHIIWRFNITCAWKESIQLIIKEKIVS